MKTLVANLALLSTLSSACATRHVPVRVTSPIAPADGINEYFQTGMKIGDRCFWHRVSDKQVANTPEWDPDSQRLPVSVQQAIDISRPVASDILGDPETIKVQGIALYENTSSERWFYVIEWRPRDIYYIGDNYKVIVLMNGSVVSANPVSCSDPDYYWSSDEPVGSRR